MTTSISGSFSAVNAGSATATTSNATKTDGEYSIRGFLANVKCLSCGKEGRLFDNLFSLYHTREIIRSERTFTQRIGEAFVCKGDENCVKRAKAILEQNFEDRQKAGTIVTYDFRTESKDSKQ